MNKKQDDDEVPGIGHNQGPAIDQEPPPESDKLNLINTVNSSGGDQHHSVDADDYSADSVANPEQQPGPKTIDGKEAANAAGYTKVAGKHVAADGLVSRRGYRRILPESRNREEIEGDLEKLDEIAKQVLRGRNATIFEKCVIRPLEDGSRRPPVEEVAAQFNIEDKRVYKILDKCWDKISGALPRFKAGAPLTEASGSPLCSICGRHESSKTICPRGHYGGCDRRSYGFRHFFGAGRLHHDLHLPSEDEARMTRFAEEQSEKWEQNYGPKRKPRLSDFFKAPKRNAK